MTDEELRAEMAALLVLARPMIETKCCHFDWCIERQGVISDIPAEGFREIDDGMHPGCAPYRSWLDRFDAIALAD